jgi:hypothetical protein
MHYGVKATFVTTQMTTETFADAMANALLGQAVGSVDDVFVLGKPGAAAGQGTCREARVRSARRKRRCSERERGACRCSSLAAAATAVFFSERVGCVGTNNSNSSSAFDTGCDSRQSALEQEGSG